LTSEPSRSAVVTTVTEIADLVEDARRVASSI
jgi:hypothetical protein